MQIVITKNGVPIRLTDERLNHIFKNHPEMEEQEEKIIATIKSPDLILAGDFGELLAAKFYPKTPVAENKYLIVAFKEISKMDGFVITAYFSRKLSTRRKVIWKL